MKKIAISILVFSLYSCSMSEHTAGYHVHSGTYVRDSDGATIAWQIEVDNNDECKFCKQ